MRFTTSITTQTLFRIVWMDIARYNQHHETNAVPVCLDGSCVLQPASRNKRCSGLFHIHSTDDSLTKPPSRTITKAILLTNTNKNKIDTSSCTTSTSPLLFSSSSSSLALPERLGTTTTRYGYHPLISSWKQLKECEYTCPDSFETRVWLELDKCYQFPC